MYRWFINFAPLNYQESQIEIATCNNEQGAKSDKPIPWKKR
ncbi:hypothetical protein SAMN05192540_3158 [Maribacter dokdonensis]|uniref:Uncharacterized protein n=1 Tax=Maribacter dokdonensis TaxID=320912 RepID=A0A1H4SGM4_9FLAO|nr:hypothetical protein I600_371 [Maribacter dokdonensis DSW-8]SEC43238.1 hypothetical protein SAMN05192540_3158 [Maribacter dokdonensis]